MSLVKRFLAVGAAGRASLMAFCMRAFCRDFAAPSLSELLVWLRQYGTPATIVGDAASIDMLTSFWDEARLSYDAGEASLTVRCLRASGQGSAAFADELADFTADVRECPDTPARGRVLEQLAATRLVVVVEYPPQGVTFNGQQTAEGIVNSLVERSGGMGQKDGAGFLDQEDDSVILALA
ncbi:MAG TPA: hypothetical protein VHU40_18240 [Polyangia bacterium]|nr:hypothetical protein [Polyangia bacterium]